MASHPRTGSVDPEANTEPRYSGTACDNSCETVRAKGLRRETEISTMFASLSLHSISPSMLDAVLKKPNRDLSKFKPRLHNASMAVGRGQCESLRDSESQTRVATVTPTTSSASPSCFSEDVLDLVLDILMREREHALRAVASESAQFTHKAMLHARAYDVELKNMTLVQRSWTRAARRALGRTLTLELGAKALDRLRLAAESPLYGPWTKHVTILELPYAPGKGEDYRVACWEVVSKTLAKLENVRSLTFNSRILKVSMQSLLRVLVCLPNLRELEFINTGVTYGTVGFASMISGALLPLPKFQKVNIRNCMPRVDPSAPYPSSSGDPLERSLSALSKSLYCARDCFFHPISFSLSRNSQATALSIDDVVLEMVHTGICTGDCTYSDIDGICASIHHLHAQNYVSTCCAAKVIRNCTQLSSLAVQLAEEPSSDFVASLPQSLEELSLQLPNTNEDAVGDVLKLLIVNDCGSHETHDILTKLKKVTLFIPSMHASWVKQMPVLLDELCRLQGVEVLVVDDALPKL